MSTEQRPLSFHYNQHLLLSTNSFIINFSSIIEIALRIAIESQNNKHHQAVFEVQSQPWVSNFITSSTLIFIAMRVVCRVDVSQKVFAKKHSISLLHFYHTQHTHPFKFLPHQRGLSLSSVKYHIRTNSIHALSLPSFPVLLSHSHSPILFRIDDPH